MLIESCEKLEFKDSTSTEPAVAFTRVKLHSKPQLYRCKLISALLGCLTTPSEKRFAETYYTWAVAGAQHTKQVHPTKTSWKWQCGDLTKKYGDFVQRWQEQQVRIDHLYRSPKQVSHAILNSLKAPLLIPQVWLNYTYRPNQTPKQEKERLGHMPMRVDFLFIREGKVHVVEVDDPSHYAAYDEQKRKWEVDEERYTNNLRVERALREQGSEIHRISNREIIEATESELIQLIPDALGISLGESQACPHIPGLESIVS